MSKEQVLSIIEYIDLYQSGKLSDIEGLYGVNEVRKLESIGIIENGLSKEGETWKITDYRIRQKSANKRGTLFDLISGFVNRRILCFNFYK